MFLCFPKYVYHYMLHPICHLYPCIPTMLLVCLSPFTLLLLHYKFMHVMQMCQNMDRLKSSTLEHLRNLRVKDFLYHITHDATTCT